MIAALAPRWRLATDPGADGATNMGRDSALLALARDRGIASLRLYSWSRPTLSFGRNERALGRFEATRLADAGVDVVRRPTGGRALLHDREVTYCVAAPLGALTPGAAYRSVNAFLRTALERLGARLQIAEPRGRALRPEGAACFAEPSVGELVIGGAKVVGSAQLLEGGAMLQHGSILLEDDQSLIATLRTPAGSAPSSLAPVGTLRSALGREVTAAEVIDALTNELRTAVTSVERAESDWGDSASVAAHRVRFTDPGWTWRR